MSIEEISPIKSLASLCDREDLSSEVIEIIRAGVKAYGELTLEDALTGIYNRRHFDDSVGKEVARSNRHRDPLSLIMLDLDHFKVHNDSYGHTEGDKVLMGVGSTIRSLMRTEDIPCRYGGEEFGIILPDTEKIGAVQLADRIKEEINKMVFYPLGEKISVTASLGVTEHRHDQSPQDLVERADGLLYQAKGNGRNRVCFD
jgi:diguanylate cyclase (GGDEF)-like protein